MNIIDVCAAVKKVLKDMGGSIAAAVADWLEDHPEATTTVEDGAITKAKLHSDLQDVVDAVGTQSEEIENVKSASNAIINGSDFEEQIGLKIGVIHGSAYGTPTTSANTLYSYQKIYRGDYKYLEFDSETYKVIFVAYSSSGAYVAVGGSWVAQSPILLETAFLAEGDFNCIEFRRNDGGDVSETDAINVGAKLTGKQNTLVYQDEFSVVASKLSAVEQISSTSENDIHGMKFRGLGKLERFVYPSGFGWQNAVNYTEILTDGKRFVYTNGAEQLKQNSSRTIYVDTKNGSSLNDGLTRNKPKASVGSAINAANNNDTILIIDEANSTIPQSLSIFAASTITKSLNIIAENPVYMYSGEVYTYTKNGNVYSTNRSNVVSVIDLKYSPEGFAYEHVASATEVGNTKGSWYVDSSNVLYIQTIDGRAPDANICVNLYNGLEVKNASIYLENITLIGGEVNGNIYVHSDVANNTYTFGAKNCRFLYSYGSNSVNKNAVFITDIELAIFENCVCAFARSDGFNYAMGSIKAPKFIELNCVAHDNGTNEAGNVNNNNGSTAHNGCYGLRINGQYYNNMGPNVSDVGTNQQSICFGCSAFSSTSTSTDWDADFMTASSSEMWFLGCDTQASESDWNFYASGGTTMHLKNCTYDNTHGGGTINDDFS